MHGADPNQPVKGRDGTYTAVELATANMQERMPHMSEDVWQKRTALNERWQRIADICEQHTAAPDMRFTDKVTKQFNGSWRE